MARILIVDDVISTGYKDGPLNLKTGEGIKKSLSKSFDETKKFIDALANMNSVNYNIKNDIPSQLLTNLASTLGINTDISPITNEGFLESVFNTKPKQIFTGQDQSQTPTELNYQYYRNLILNAAYMFKSKGTRKSLEYIMRFVGAPFTFGFEQVGTNCGLIGKNAAVEVDGSSIQQTRKYHKNDAANDR